MFLYIHSPTVRKQTQGGAALVVSLIILSLMTAIGVAAMETTILQSKMAGNIQAEITAFNNAESSLRSAEDEIRMETNNSTPAIFSDWPWLYGSNDTLPSLSVQGSLNSSNSGDGDNARYIVQYIGSHALAGNSSTFNSSGGITGSVIHMFQIDSKSDEIQGATKIVRSIYATVNAP